MEVLFILFIIFGVFLISYLICAIYNNYYNNTRVDENLTSNDTQIGSIYIPKNIYQLIKDKNDVNPSFQKNINYIKDLNPDWKHILMDDNDMIKYMEDNYPSYILDVYKRINTKYGAAKADFFRYLLMYKEGGAYFDIKSAMKYPLDQIIKYDDEYILTHDKCLCQRSNIGNEDGEFQQWYIICKPGHPFLKSVIDTVIKNILNYDIKIDGTGKPGVLKITGPIAYTKSIIPIMEENKYTIYEHNEHIGLLYNNIDERTHVSLFSKTHYSNLDEPIILKSTN
jgi:hypothetical protein